MLESKCKKYTLEEIFYSIQGEGRYSGFPVVFVRFTGCNRKCEFCDEGKRKMEDGIEYTAYEIAGKVNELADDAFAVVLTGGEPTLQIDTHLLRVLKTCKPRNLHIETNGDNFLTEEMIDMFDHIVISPKDVNAIASVGLSLNNSNSVGLSLNNSKLTRDKFVIKLLADKSVFGEHTSADDRAAFLKGVFGIFIPIYIQPLVSKENSYMYAVEKTYDEVKNLISACADYDLNVHLSLQAHKIFRRK